ncbi:MAG: hypothetical protein IKG97_04585 [Lachnospiraceae bacterium]|nr:hypothetical protein [Lachnospiraceae bacterium]
MKDHRVNGYLRRILAGILAAGLILAAGCSSTGSHESGGPEDEVSRSESPSESVVPSGSESPSESAAPSGGESPAESITPSESESPSVPIPSEPAPLEPAPWEDASLPPRERVVAYMTALSQVEWTPSEKIDLTKSKKNLMFFPEVQYKGLPYTNDWDGSLEEFRSYLREGVYLGPVTDEECRGVDCSSSVLSAWAVVSTSFDCVWTRKMLPQAGCGTIRVGDYVIPEGSEGTEDIIRANEEQRIYEAYAALLPGDAVVQYTDHGHARMIVGEPDVRRNADGTISGLSSVVTTEIDSRLRSGEGYASCWIVEHTYYFRDLIDDFYIPLTIPELVSGEAPELSLTLNEDNTAETLLAEGGLRGTLESNYRITMVKASVLEEAAGNAGGGSVGVKTVRESLYFPVNNIDLVMSSRMAELSKLNETLDICSLPAGRYVLKLTAKAAGETREVFQIEFEKP